MASTNLSNIDYQSSSFSDIMLGEFTNRLGFLTSGVLKEVPDTPKLNSQTKGDTASMPHWATLSGSSAQITSSSNTVLNSLATYKDIAVWIEREIAWSSDQLIAIVSGADPTREMARQLGEYWANELHRVFISGPLAGVFATELATSHSTGNTFSGGKISVDGINAAKLKLGDNSDLLNTALVNSAVYYDMILQKIVPDFAGAGQFKTGQVPQVWGLAPVMTDKLVAVGGVYPTYFSALGSCAYKFRERTTQAMSVAQYAQDIYTYANNIQVELYRNATTAGGQDFIISRASFFTHVPGVKWNSATTNPTDAQLATGSNWTKVATDDKLIRIVQLNTAT